MVWLVSSLNFCERSDIIDALVDGALIIEVRMMKSAPIVTVGTVTPTTSADKEWKSFEVRFDGFAKLPAKKGEDVFSPAFTCFRHKWRLKIYPGGDRTSDDGMVAAYLEHRSRTSIMVQYELRIRDKEGNTKKEY